jgi:error-prone DNA polymerase
MLAKGFSEAAMDEDRDAWVAWLWGEASQGHLKTPMSYCREALAKQQVKRACDLPRLPDGQYTRVAGCVIARQRPGTAKGFVFLSLEDETGISNVIVNPDLYEKYRKVINREKFLRVEGVLQNQDNVISIKASRVLPVAVRAIETESHDFH